MTIEINDQSYMRKFLFFILCLTLTCVADAREKVFTVTSPDMKNEVSVFNTDTGFCLQISHNGKDVCRMENISMTVDGAEKGKYIPLSRENSRYCMTVTGFFLWNTETILFRCGSTTKG